MNKILLIGGEGYIGNIISNDLLKKNFNVTSYDNLIYNNQNCVLGKTQFENYKYVYGDILDKERVEPEIIEAHAVVLLAGLVGDPITKKYPEESAIINDSGVKNIIDLCSKHNKERFIFISTCSNYGLIKEEQLADENFRLNPLSLYAKSKVKAEEYILSLKDRTKMNPTILRFATAFGLSPRMRFDLTISEFTRDIFLGKSLVVYDAETWRPYCHVKDFSRLIQKVIHSSSEKTAWQVFNSGGDKNNATKKMITDLILNHIPNGKITYQEHGSDPRNYRVNFEKVQNILDFTPKYSVEDGIVEVIEMLQKNVFKNISKNKSFFGNYEIDYNGAKP
tara:strand:+ start:188 stop:1195 length:1008 start_codon:yes stop_codon:yes gene_type:complete